MRRQRESQKASNTSFEVHVVWICLPTNSRLSGSNKSTAAFGAPRHPRTQDEIAGKICERVDSEAGTM